MADRALKAPIHEAPRAKAPVLSTAPKWRPVLPPKRRDAAQARSHRPGQVDPRSESGLLGDAARSSISPAVGAVVSRPGAPLDAATRQWMEARFSRDFGGVRIHDGADAAESARSLGADAYTVGQDVVFARGRYEPGKSRGRRLLAHELAHTIQQGGTPPGFAASGLHASDQERAMERQAEDAATRVMQGRAPFVSGVIQPSRPVVSRQPAGAGSASSDGEREVLINTGQMGTMSFRVTPAQPAEESSGGRRHFLVRPFFVPRSKQRKGFEHYQLRAQRNSLQAIVRMSGRRAMSMEAKETRLDTNGLRRRWLQFIGVANLPTADREWKQAGGDATFPKVHGKTAEMDHIIELQVGGDNSGGNLQPLEKSRNGDSGTAIKAECFQLAEAVGARWDLGGATTIQFDFPEAVDKATGVSPNFEDVTPAEVPGADPPRKQGSTVLSIAAAMIENIGSARPGGGETGGAAPGSASYTVTARPRGAGSGGASAALAVPADWSAGVAVPIHDDPSNRAAGTLISGLLLKSIKKGTGHQGETVVATVDNQSDGATGVPITIEEEQRPIELIVGPQPDGVLRLKSGNVNLKVRYRYLSEGRITRIAEESDGGISWSGEIQPSIPFLPNKLTIEYKDDVLKVTTPLSNAKRFRSPLPGVTVSRADLSLILSPALSAQGNLGFRIGGARKPLATGEVTVGADSNGLNATGTLAVNFPGLDAPLNIVVNYQAGNWSAEGSLASEQIPLPYLEGGRLGLRLDADGVHPTGELHVKLPSDVGRATLELKKVDGRYLYRGVGQLKVPGLREVEIGASYDGETLTASASKIRFVWRGFNGEMNVSYSARRGGEGRITGRGQVTIERGDLRGRLDATLNNNGKFSGRGTVTYPFSIRGERIEATAGITVDPEQNVHLDGALRFPRPIVLFDRFEASKTIFSMRRSIPIPGLSIAGVGLNVVIEAGLHVRYGLGAGELRNVEIAAAFNPFEDNTNAEIAFHCDLHIPASAGISGTFGGGLEVSAYIAAASGTITVTASLDLGVVAGGSLDLRYSAARFELEAKPSINAALDLGLSLEAHASARAGIGPFSVGVHKTWKLGQRRARVGEFSMKVPIAWKSDKEFQAPGVDDIEWGPAPQIDVGNVLKQLIDGSEQREE